jgi:hypothetical protein
MARELVTKHGIGESADALWNSSRHSNCEPNRQSRLRRPNPKTIRLRHRQ